MRSKISSLWSAIILGIAGVACLGTIIFFLITDLPSYASYIEATLSPHALDPQNSKFVGAGLPIRLTIPKINIDTAIESLGLTPEGAMDVPKGPADVAWFDLGPRPGMMGSAVIAGHEGWKDGISAAFDDLHELQSGDEVYVVDDTGATTTFVVRSVATYDQNGDASDIFNSRDGKAHLNLITCEGIWNAAERSYSNRLVVFTDEE
jgi:LPXTG-site transpeptidase (sortase) family protein